MGNEAARLVRPVSDCLISFNRLVLNDIECTSDSRCCTCAVRTHDTSHEENLEDSKAQGDVDVHDGE